MKDGLSLVNKSWLFLSGLCILLLIFLASEARADQQGFDEFVARANVKMMIKNKHPEWLYK